MNTKGLNIEQIDKFCEMLRTEHRSGRADLAPEMHKFLHDKICERYNSTNTLVSKRPRRRNANKNKDMNKVKTKQKNKTKTKTNMKYHSKQKENRNKNITKNTKSKQN